MQITILYGALAKNGSFVFAEALALRVGAKTNVPFVGRKRISFFCALAKKLKHEALGCCVGKKSACWSFIPVVLIFCLSVYGCPVFFSTLAANGFGLGEGGDF